jgi:hypothetical protein
MPVLSFGSRTIAYDLRLSPRRSTVSITVEPARGVIVAAPQGVSSAALEGILLRKAPWIIRKLREAPPAPQPAPKEFVSGESFPYLGRRYRLKVREDDRLSVALRGDRIIVTLPGKDDASAVRAALVKWFEERARERLPERVDLYSARMGVAPSRVVVKHQERRWGSCARDGAIYLNWRIIMVPLSVVDYLVVHELCHLKVRAHSQDFWHAVECVLPDQKQRRDWLRRNGPFLTL